MQQVSFAKFKKIRDRLSERELEILNGLAAGENTIEIAKNFNEKGAKPNSLSFVDKPLKQLRKRFEAKTIIQLIFDLRVYINPIKTKNGNFS